MEIIKQGKNMNINPKYIVTCGKCDCTFTFIGRDIHSDFRDGPYVICPNETCKSFINPNVAKIVNEG